MRTPTPQAFIVIIAAVGGAALTALFGFGPLDPPNGPITPTYKTLSEVEPRIAINATNTPGDADSVFKIDGVGSYYLTGPISVPSGKHGIEVVFGNVTLDLNGFRITGQNGSLDGIRLTGSPSPVTIRNGDIFNPGGTGINAAGAPTLRIDGVTVLSAGGQGIVTGSGCEIANCSVSGSASHGINTADSCRLSGCITRDNGGIGIDVDDNSSVRDCIAEGNAADGISANAGCAVVGCTASANTLDGFVLSASATVTGCAASSNLENGFTANESAILTDCQASGNHLTGFRMIARSRATRCSARDNDEYGFHLSEGNSVIQCTVTSNSSGVWIDGNANTVEGCTAHENTNSGIYVFDGSGNNIDGNLATFNGAYGVALAKPDNLMVRNRSRGNSAGSYLAIQGTDYGVILINPGEGFSSSAAWANFAY